MKNIFICLITITAIAFAGCKGNSSKKNTESNENQNVETKDYQNTNSEIKQPSYLLTATDLPQEVDLNQDISQLSLQESNLLSNYVFATHGLCFIDSDLYSYFSANTKWYANLIYALYYAGEKTARN